MDMNRLTTVTEQLSSEVTVDGWVRLDAIARTGLFDLDELLDEFREPPWSELLDQIGLPCPPLEEVERAWDEAGEPVEGRPTAREWLVAVPIGDRALILPDDADPRPSVQLLFAGDQRAGLRTVILQLDGRSIRELTIRAAPCHKNSQNGVCTGPCRNGGTCDNQRYRNPSRLVCECLH
jgi:hypothetical protein